MIQEQLRKDIEATFDNSRIIQKNILATNFPIHASRVPDLRKIAKLYKDDLNVLDNYRFDSYEDVMIYGLILCVKKRDNDAFIHYMNPYIRVIDSWCYTDSIFKGYTGFNDALLAHYHYLLNDSWPYAIRLYLNMLLEASKYLPLNLIDLIQEVKEHSYSVDMMIAWILQICLAKDYENNLVQIKKYTYSYQIIQMAIRKCKDSYVFTKGMKQEIEQELTQCIE